MAKRTMRVEASAAIFEFPICCGVNFKSRCREREQSARNDRDGLGTYLDGFWNKGRKRKLPRVTQSARDLSVDERVDPPKM